MREHDWMARETLRLKKTLIRFGPLLDFTAPAVLFAVVPSLCVKYSICFPSYFSHTRLVVKMKGTHLSAPSEEDECCFLAKAFMLWSQSLQKGQTLVSGKRWLSHIMQASLKKRQPLLYLIMTSINPSLPHLHF